jgi:hypothetical protein
VELQEIDVFIDADGQVRIEVRGVKGTGCLELTHDLETALGGQVEDREMTLEAGEAPGEVLESERQRSGQGRAR